MAGRRRGGFFGHARRVGDRVGRRARRFVNEARGGTYDHVRLAQDVGSAIVDTFDLFGGLFGGGASPAIGLVNIGPAAAAAYTGANGRDKTVLLNDAVPEDAVWPIIGGPLPVLRLAPLNNPAGLVDLQLLRVESVDAEDVELRVAVRTVGAAVAPGEYYGTLYYESASEGPGQYPVATIRAVVT